MSISPADQAKIKELQRQVTQLSQELDAARDNHSKVSSAHQSLKDTIKRQEGTVEADRKSIDKLKPQIDQLHHSQSGLEGYVDQLSQVTSKTKRIAATVAGMKNVNAARGWAEQLAAVHTGQQHKNALQSVGKANEDIKGQLCKAKGDLSDKEGEVKSLNKKIEEERGQLSDYAAKKSGLETAINSYQSQISQLQEQIRQLQQS
jgi:chromosome segregation ATPase